MSPRRRRTLRPIPRARIAPAFSTPGLLGAPHGEVSERLHVPPRTLRNLVDDGKIPALRNSKGGIFFSPEQERIARRVIAELGLARD